MDFKLTIENEYFNATDLVNQHNLHQGYRKLKRLHSFTHIGQKNVAFIAHVDEIDPPATKVHGRATYRSTWFKLAILPVFLLWLNPTWAVQLMCTRMALTQKPPVAFYPYPQNENVSTHEKAHSSDEWV